MNSRASQKDRTGAGEAHKGNVYEYTNTYIRVEPKLTDVTGDDLFLLGYHGNAKGVVDDSLLHRVHLQQTQQK